MAEERKGFLTPQQEEILDKLIELKGIYEALDGPAIKIADNTGLQKVKESIPVEVLPVVYMVIDEIFAALVTTTPKAE